MLVNLFVDHFLAPAPGGRVRAPEEILYSMNERPELWKRAARAIGLTPAEYRQVHDDFVSGNYTHRSLPRRLDAMSGDRRGTVYAVHNAVIKSPSASWPAGYRVVLADGAQVYIPDICGNLSVLRSPQRLAKLPPITHAPPHYRLALASTPIDQPVTVTPPDVPAQPAIAQAVPATIAHAGCAWWCFAAPLLGIVPAVDHGSSTPPTLSAPPCTQGSNAAFVCQK
jgi:hypothetical protein